jgi:hypothetical protein
MKKSEGKFSIDGTDTTAYSPILDLRHAASGSIQLAVTEDTASFAATATIWASNKDNPDLTDDTDWVEVTSLLTAPTISGTGKSYIVIEPADGVFDKYRVKCVRSGGAGTIRFWNSAKDTR